MKELNIKFYFGFEYYADEEAKKVEISDELYERLQEIYNESGAIELTSIYEYMVPADDEYEELEQLIAELKDELIGILESKGENIDLETGEQTDLSELNVEIEIVVPDEWDE